MDSVITAAIPLICREFSRRGYKIIRSNRQPIAYIEVMLFVNAQYKIKFTHNQWSTELLRGSFDVTEPGFQSKVVNSIIEKTWPFAP